MIVDSKDQPEKEQPLSQPPTAGVPVPSSSRQIDSNSWADVSSLPPPPAYDAVTVQQSVAGPPNSDSNGGHFVPFVLLSHSDDFHAGFPTSRPRSQNQPHPFMTHEIKQEDWLRFLRELQHAAKGSTLEQIGYGFVDVAEGIPLLGLVIPFGIIQKQLGKKRLSPVGPVIDQWNQEYFHPRSMQVTLARGNKCYPGPKTAVPADIQHKWHNNEDSDTNDESSSSEEEHNVGAHKYDVQSGESGLGRDGFLGRGRRREERRERRRARREAREAFKHELNDKWRLVISFRPLEVQPSSSLTGS